MYPSIVIADSPSDSSNLGGCRFTTIALYRSARSARWFKVLVVRGGSMKSLRSFVIDALQQLSTSIGNESVSKVSGWRGTRSFFGAV